MMEKPNFEQPAENPYTATLEARLNKMKGIIAGIDIVEARQNWRFVLLKGTDSSKPHTLKRFIIYGEPINKALGALEVKSYAKGTELHIENMEIREDLRQKGLGTLMLLQSLALFPETQIIIGTPAQDNKAIFDSALEVGLSEDDALRRMPFSRSCSALGFINQRIDRQNINGFALIASKLEVDHIG